MHTYETLGNLHRFITVFVKDQTVECSDRLNGSPDLSQLSMCFTYLRLE